VVQVFAFPRAFARRTRVNPHSSSRPVTPERASADQHPLTPACQHGLPSRERRARTDRRPTTTRCGSSCGIRSNEAGACPSPLSPWVDPERLRERDPPFTTGLSTRIAAPELSCGLPRSVLRVRAEACPKNPLLPITFVGRHGYPHSGPIKVAGLSAPQRSSPGRHNRIRNGPRVRHGFYEVGCVRLSHDSSTPFLRTGRVREPRRECWGVVGRTACFVCLAPPPRGRRVPAATFRIPAKSSRTLAVHRAPRG